MLLVLPAAHERAEAAAPGEPLRLLVVNVWVLAAQALVVGPVLMVAALRVRPRVSAAHGARRAETTGERVGPQEPG